MYAGAPSPDPACINLYVTPNGSPSGDGTRLSPVDLPTAIGMATCNNAVLKLAVGQYNFDQAIQLFDYMTIEGGFLPNTNWEKVSSDGTLATTTIINRTNSGAHPYDGIANAPALMTMYGNGIGNFRLQDITLTTADAPPATAEGISTYGLYLNNCHDYNIVRCRMLPGNASPGANGADGAAGTDGLAGGNGQAGCSADPIGPAGTNCSTQVSAAPNNGGGAVNASGNGGGGANPGGRGGKGAWRTYNFGNGNNNGENGITGTGTGAGTGGGGGEGNGPAGVYIYNCECDASSVTHGANGNNGTNGANGNNGALSAATPSLAALFIPGGIGTNGTVGTNGAGGGGGGGGGGQDATEGTVLPSPLPTTPISADLGSDAGAGGGGGGGGGGAGTSGTGAYSGGGSFGAYIWSNGANGNIIDCNLNAGNAAQGGQGGAGGTGGLG
ncbi:MAG TPA: hypothetical protein PK230_13435, partial [Chitinophagales bacterium]|nr:hypothetical protein [Chitinophagales bacterium]